MFDKLRAYIDEQFREAPPTRKTVEMKEEILQNLQDKYYDLIAEGRGEEAAYNIAVASIGDLSDLIAELKTSKITQLELELDPRFQKERLKNAILTASAVVLYIISLIPLLALVNPVGFILMLVIIAVATAILIINSMTKSPFYKHEETMAEEFRRWRGSSIHNNKKVFRSVASALWSLTVVIYILISFSSGAWHITWVLFLITVAISSIIKAVLDTSR